MTETQSEADLALAAAAGSPAALGALYERHADAVFRVAYRLTGSSPEAEDVLHDVFAALPEKLRSFDPQRPLAPWLRRIAITTAVSRLRSSGRRSAREGEYSVLVPPPSSPIDHLVVRDALDRPPSQLRAVLVLKEVEGYSHREICELLGISENAVAVRLHRAWKQLRRQTGE